MAHRHVWEKLPTVRRQGHLPDWRRRCVECGEVQIEKRSRKPGARNYTYTWIRDETAACVSLPRRTDG